MPHILVIGAGPGGYSAAFEAARKGAQVTLVEAAELGGTCLNTGCIPTKSLRSSADALVNASRLAQFGIRASEGATFAADMHGIVARKNNITKILRGGLEKTCTALKVRLIRGKAKLTGGTSVQIHTEAGVEDIKADSIIIASGSRCLDLPSLPVDHKVILNSDDALDLDNVPQRVVIVGGGVIGCEMAFILNAFGAQVTIVEGQNRLLPMPSVDEDMSKLLQREGKKQGIRTELARTVKNVSIKEGVAHCLLGPSPFIPNAPTAETELETDIVLVTIGRASNAEGLGLEAVGIKTDKHGWIEADMDMKTSAPNIYAIGDALGPSRIMLAHTATAEGLCAVASIFGEKGKVNYDVMPSGIFTSPEIGAVGLTEAEARQKGITARSVTVQFRELGKAQAMGELPGIFKLVCEEGTGKLLGAHIAGAHATDLIAEPTLALQEGLTVKDIAHTIHSHPTLAEGVYEAAEAWLRG